MSNISKYMIEKSNVLNYFKCVPHNPMTINELRFFCMYLSRINAREPNKRTIEISIDDFEKMFQIKINTFEFEKVIDKILNRSIYIHDEKTNEDMKINLYSCFAWKKDFENQIIKITANYDILLYLFMLKDNYTSYRLINISKLNTVSKIRLYEIMCQYKKIGEISLETDELQAYLMTNFSLFKEFKRQIINPAIESINEFTDLIIECKNITHKRKVTALKFIIKEKREDTQKTDISEPTEKEKEIPEIPLNTNDYFAELYNRYFIDRNINPKDAKKIIKRLKEKINSSSDEELENYINNLMTAYDKQRERKILDSKTGYIIGMIENNAFLQEPEYEEREEQSYDINEFEKYAVNYETFSKCKKM